MTTMIVATFSILFVTISLSSIMIKFPQVQFYFYAVLGMEIFGNQFDQLSVAEYPNPEANFDSIGHTLIALFQLLVHNQWQSNSPANFQTNFLSDVMYAAIETTNTIWSSLYFISFYFFAVIIIMK